MRGKPDLRGGVWRGLGVVINDLKKREDNERC